MNERNILITNDFTKPRYNRATLYGVKTVEMMHNHGEKKGSRAHTRENHT